MIQKDDFNAGDKLSLLPREYTLGFHLVPPTKYVVGEQKNLGRVGREQRRFKALERRI